MDRYTDGDDKRAVRTNTELKWFYCIFKNIKFLINEVGSVSENTSTTVLGFHFFNLQALTCLCNINFFLHLNVER